MTTPTGHSWSWRGLRLRLGNGVDIFRSAGVRYTLRRLADGVRSVGRGHGRRHAAYHQIWSEAAAALGAELLERPDGALQIRRGIVRVTLHQHRVGLDQPERGHNNDKMSARALLTEAGLSAPDAVAVDAADLGPAFVFLARSRSPVVVKPVDTGGGRGVTTGVQTPEQLKRALTHAARFSPRLAVEAQSEGDQYRFLILDGELLDVVRRHSPRLTGDGRSTIRRLLAAENRRGQAAGDWGVLRGDLDCVLTLERQGLTLDSVPAAGIVFEVKKVNNYTRHEDAKRSASRSPTSYRPRC